MADHPNLTYEVRHYRRGVGVLANKMGMTPKQLKNHLRYGQVHILPNGRITYEYSINVVQTMTMDKELGGFNANYLYARHRILGVKSARQKRRLHRKAHRAN